MESSFVVHGETNIILSCRQHVQPNSKSSHQNPNQSATATYIRLFLKHNQLYLRMSESPDNENVDNQEVEELSEREALIRSLARDFSSYTHDGYSSVYIKLVHNREEAEQDIKAETFFPDFVHQFFGPNERIFGYKKPVLRLFYSASRLRRYIKFDYEDKLTQQRDSIEPDDVMDMLSPILEDTDFTQDLNQFISEVESQEEKDFKPPGELLHEFEANYRKPKLIPRAQLEQQEFANSSNGDHKQNGSCSSNNVLAHATQNGDASTCHQESPVLKKKYQILHANAETKGFPKFQARMQTLIMWFIESATMIDFEDPRWDFFMIFERYNPSYNSDPQAPTVSTEDRYHFAGYATVYRYYAYPDRTRPRVSQMLLLPPYRRNGLGTKLLQAIYDYYINQPATLDITAEDPDEEFIAMRDFLDCLNCSKLPMFQIERLRQGWSDEIAKEAQDKLKLCQRQSRKVYEILKLKGIQGDDEDENRNYRLEIKNRLNIPHRRLKLDCDKVVKLGIEIPEEMKTQRDNPRLVLASLEENYQELIKQYRHTIDKLIKPIL